MPRPDAGPAVAIPVEGRVLEGSLQEPDRARGLVIFAHGSGSSRHSPRTRYVANVLVQAGLAALLVDLLTVEEEARDALTGFLRSDVQRLAGRLLAATDWAAARATAGLPVGYFGVSTGAGAALVAAAARPERVRAVVCRGGRPDLAGEALGRVRAPTLLIVGGRDERMAAPNRAALAALTVEARLVVVAGATHLFEEPGALERVAAAARDWYERHLPPAAPVFRQAG